MGEPSRRGRRGVTLILAGGLAVLSTFGPLGLLERRATAAPTDGAPAAAVARTGKPKIAVLRSEDRRGDVAAAYSAMG